MFETSFITALLGTIIAALLWYIYSNRRSPPKTPLLNLEKNKLHTLIEATVGTTGDSFFYALSRELSRYLDIDAVFLAASTDNEHRKYQTKSYWSDDGYVMNQPLTLSHLSGFEGSGMWHLENSANELFPDVELFRDRFIVSGFFAFRLQDSSGRLIGLLAGLNRQSIKTNNAQLDVIKLFAARAAAELERLVAINETLMEKERAQITLQSIGESVITTDSIGRINFMNPVAEGLTGWLFHQAQGMSLEAVLHLEDEKTGQVIPDPSLRCLTEKRVVSPSTDNVLISRIGERHSIQGTAAPMFDGQDNSIGVVLVFKDVSDSRRLQKLMVHQATHDPLTGLVNRSEFEERLDKALTSAQEFENTHALLFLDLDQFKIVNDSVGHAAGDELLKQISMLLAGQLRGRDTLGRMGGDEFSVLLENCPVSKAKKVANNLIDVIHEYRFVWDEKTYQVGVSIGIVPITASALDSAQLMSNADKACYKAKDMGRGQAYIFTNKDAGSNQPLVGNIHRDGLIEAIAAERFQLLYQPIVSLDVEQTILHTRAEVLIRMLDSASNHLTPGAFLPAASRFGLMQQIDRWVLKKIFTDYAHLFMQNPDLVLSLNLSSEAVADPALADYIIQLFDQSVIHPHQICFEISETTLINNHSSVIYIVDRIGELGCSFAIDDFGSGLSSFAYLKDLKIDFLNIDGSLVRDICNDPIDCAMVESIRSIGHMLGIKTTGKCADSETIIARLKVIGIDYAQGYYLGNPVSMDDISGLRDSKQPLSNIEVN